MQPSLSQSTQQLIEKICRFSEDYGFCRKTLEEHLKSPNADIVAVTQITVEQAADHATKTHEFIRQTYVHLKRQARDPALKCDLADLSFASSRTTTVRVEKNERQATRLEASCEQTLHSPPKKQHILDERNREMRILLRPRNSEPAPLAVAPF